MGDLADRLNGLTVEAVSPDGRIAASVARQGRAIRLNFGRGAYSRYSEAQLAHQLGHLATLVWTRYRRDCVEIVEHALGTPWCDDGADLGPERRTYRERLEQLDVIGRCAATGVEVTSRSLVRWEFTIARGTLDRLRESQFVAGVLAAVADLLGDYRARVLSLQDEVYGLGFPDQLREAIGLPPRPVAGLAGGNP